MKVSDIVAEMRLRSAIFDRYRDRSAKSALDAMIGWIENQTNRPRDRRVYFREYARKNKEKIKIRNAMK